MASDECPHCGSDRYVVDEDELYNKCEECGSVYRSSRGTPHNNIYIYPVTTIY